MADFQGTITAGTIGTGTIGPGNPIIEQTVNRMLQSGVDTGQVFSQQLLRMNAGDQNLAETLRQDYNLSNQSAMAVIVQALLGSDPSLDSNILAARSAGAQPQSGGGPGQPTSFPVQQQLPGTGGVYVVNPTTGTISKAS
jgi:hypothetical protein